MNRKIIHIDMDAFYASVEQLENPELRGKPVAVGGGAERGVVAAASYEARKYGVYSAMSSKMAAKLCPEIIFVKPNFKKYRAYSKKIHKIFKKYTNLIEPLSLDEAYLDVSVNKMNQKSATFIANAIKNEIYTSTGLTASAGISYNKFFAKIASDMDKPNGIYVIKPSDAEKFISNLSIKKFHGVGKVTEEKMKKMGIFKGKDLKIFQENELIYHFGKSGSFLFHILRGIDERPVNPDRKRKSIGAENTLSIDVVNIETLRKEGHRLAEKVFEKCMKHNLYAKTVTLKIKFSDFNVISRSHTNTTVMKDISQIKKDFDELLQSIFPLNQAIRLIGVSVSNFDEAPSFSVKQLDLF